MATQVEFQKLSAEEITLEFDMLSRLRSGVTVSTAIVTCEVYSGTDASAADMVSGDATVSGSIISQKIVDGVGGNIYKISCAIRTSDNDILINEAKLVVLTSNAAVP